MQIKQVKIKDINLDGPIRNPLLPAGFIKRVQRFKKVLAEVETMTLEETILNFQKDQHPEKELVLWEHIALNYQRFTKVNKKLALKGKKDVLGVLLGLSMGAKTFKDVKNLNRQQIKKLRNDYLNL